MNLARFRGSRAGCWRMREGTGRVRKGLTGIRVNPAGALETGTVTGFPFSASSSFLFLPLPILGFGSPVLLPASFLCPPSFFLLHNIHLISMSSLLCLSQLKCRQELSSCQNTAHHMTRTWINKYCVMQRKCCCDSSCTNWLRNQARIYSK